jgi:hypothetical protein
MVATAQVIDRGFERGGPGATGGSRAASAGKDRSRTILQNKRLHAAIGNVADQLA